MTDLARTIIAAKRNAGDAAYLIVAGDWTATLWWDFRATGKPLGTWQIGPETFAALSRAGAIEELA